MASRSATSTTTTATTATPPKKPPKIKQACDCCHARKIRCNGASPCNNCDATSLPCTYLLIPKKKGPKGPSNRTPRAVLKMRMNQEQTAKPETSLPDIHPAMSPPLVSPMRDSGFTDGFVNNQGFEPSPLLSMDVVEKHLESFFDHKYPVFPILDRDRLLDSLDLFYTSPEVYGLVTSLCAAISSQAKPDLQSASSVHSSSSDFLHSPDFFINEAKRSKAANPSYVEKPMLKVAQTNFFLFAALFNLDRHNSAWFFLREAMTMLQMLRLHEEDTYSTIEDELDAIYSRRTFWLFFITERAYALQRHRPLTLQRTIDLPTISPDDPDAPVISGFLDLVSLFQHFNDDFVRLWNFSSKIPTFPFSHEISQESSSQLGSLQKVLDSSIPDLSKRTEVQQADLLISRQWLKTMVWQLCVSKGLLSSSSNNESMSFHYPVSIARGVFLVSRGLSKEAYEPHGVGILEKIFDIGCSLADVLQLHSVSSQNTIGSMEIGPKEYLMEMLSILSTVVGGSAKYLPMLVSKVNESLHIGLRGTLESSNSKIIDLEEEEVGSYAEGMEPSTAVESLDTSNYDGASTFDFGALSEASMAWLGSMSDESFGDIAGVPVQPLYQHG